MEEEMVPRSNDKDSNMEEEIVRESLSQSIIQDVSSNIDDTGRSNDETELDEYILNSMLDSAMNDTYEVASNDPVPINDRDITTEYVVENFSADCGALEKTAKLCNLPLGRVKSIMKSDPDIQIVSLDCIFLASKACEIFLQWLGKEVHSYTMQQKKKTIQKRDLDRAISEHPALEFLDGALD